MCLPLDVGKGEAERTLVHANPGVGSVMMLNLAAENYIYIISFKYLILLAGMTVSIHTIEDKANRAQNRKRF